MKEMMRYGLVLTIICMIAAGLLAGVYTLTKPRILVQAQAEEKTSLKEVMPEAVDFIPLKEKGETLYYRACDKDGKFIGVAFKADADGYSSTIEVMVGMLKDSTITAIKILEQNETPGLGTRVTEASFTDQFKHKNLQNFDEVQAITGATISSTAVLEAVKQKMQKILSLIKNER